jgi:predicted rRNA methylase YqxC with S4 and FtsJ domains
MNILVDVGNTSIKWQFRQDQQVVGTEVGDLNSLEAQLALRGRFVYCHGSSLMCSR